MFINQILTKLKSLVYSKSETDSLLNGKASSSHTHTKSQITDFPTIPSKVSQLTNDSGFITGVSWDSVSGKPSTFTPSSHTHTKSQITDFPSYGTTAGTICQGNDSRLSDARTPYFANGTWYAVGDDAAIGDHNVSGGLGVKALNSNTTRIDLCYTADASNYKSITYDGTTLYMNGNCDYATNANYANSAGSAGSAGEVSTSVAAGSTKNLVYATMSNNDQCRIMCGGGDNDGYMEIATSDDGNEPIYVRQYNNGAFGSIVRTLTLLDGSGNTQFPGTVTAPTFSGNLNGNCSGTAGGVAWNNVSGRPWALSQFTNDSGFITSAIKESNYSSNEKYCLLYGNLLIQFGTNVFEAQSGNVTFKKSFSSAPIVVVNYGDDVGFSSSCCLDEAYTTYFTVKQATASSAWRVNWIAIGTC